ncbi:MAG: DNA mismatch repair endonuclease MutL [Pirellulaceae bacterium]|nr:DNA mismatch repair endonuclease MutL [Planctomycetaceae bacterium]
MPEIRQLSASVINKIAAGEVIERPSSVVKELVENAVDAGSSRVDVSVEKGGLDLVRVSDNGSGIEQEQLVLALASHATSKIHDADDLFSVLTMGFRGEALASIAEISHLTMTSRTVENDAAATVESNGGRLQGPRPIGAPVGTSVEIRNLFFNTPVRRKFMRTPQTEMGHVSEAFLRIAIAHPDIHFTLRHNERAVHDLPPVDNWKQRLTAVFGRELAEHLIWIENSDDETRLWGFVADPVYHRGNNRMQYLFLNRRHIRDRSLQHALGEAYRGLLLHGRHPVAFLQLEMPPNVVDVNVHPSKLEVRFENSRRLYSQVLGTLRTKFLSTDLTARVEKPDVEPSSGNIPSAVSGGPSLADSLDRQNQSRLDLDYGPRPEVDFGGVVPARDQWAAPLGETGRPLHGVGVASNVGGDGEIAATNDTMPPDRTAGDISARLVTEATYTFQGMQAHNRYLITESEDGVLVIDQHALHERILYERFREKVLSGKLEVQRLLVPETITMTPSEVAVGLENKDLLHELGIEIEHFGGDTLVINGYPTMLAKVGAADVLRWAIDRLIANNGRAEKRDLIDEILHMMSCKAAVKAGDPLCAEEITALLEHRELCQDAHHCPHGRPTSLVFSRQELDRRFQRI